MFSASFLKGKVGGGGIRLWNLDRQGVKSKARKHCKIRGNKKKKKTELKRSGSGRAAAGRS